MPSARPRGMIVTLWIGSDSGIMQRDQRMAGLVIGGQALFLVGHHHGAPLGAHHDLVLGGLEFGHGDHALADAGRQQAPPR